MVYVKYFVSRGVHNWVIDTLSLRKNPFLVGIKLDADSYGNFEGISLSNQLNMFIESTIGQSFLVSSHFLSPCRLKSLQNMYTTKVLKFDMEPEVIVDKQVATTHLFKCLESIPICPYRLSRYSL